MAASHPLGTFWSLAPGCTYLNHGSFGPAPGLVLAARRAWSERLARQPMRFFLDELEPQLDRAADRLAAFVGTQPDRLALLDNATFAMNVVAASVPLAAGDEVLLTDHEYGAVQRTWHARCAAVGARCTTATLPVPPTDDGVVAAIEAAVTPRTRLLVVSHVASATAWVLPVARICRLARVRGVPVCIDGPHALAMLDLELDTLGCDYYCASCHKWLCGPFGSGFLWVHPDRWSTVTSPVVSWGDSPGGRSPAWQDRTNWLGTRDPAALLAVADAVDFFDAARLAAFRSHAHAIVAHARRGLLALPGTGPLCTPDESGFVSMAAVELPPSAQAQPAGHSRMDPLQRWLRRERGIEVLVGSWGGRRYLRVSAHLYSLLDDAERLLTALREAPADLVH